MVQIKVNGRFLDMPTDAKIQISMSSPLFSQDSVAGTFAYPFYLPFTDINDAAFNFAFNEAAYKISKSFPCEIYISGTPYKSGILNLKSIPKKGYSASVNMDAGVLKSSIAGKDLSEIGMPVIKIQDITDANPYPYVLLKLNTIEPGTNNYRVGNFLILRNGAVVNQYKFRWDATKLGFPTKESTIQSLSAYITTPTPYNTISGWKAVQSRNTPEHYNQYGTPDYLSNKFWVYAYNGVTRLFRLLTLSGGGNTNVTTANKMEPSFQPSPNSQGVHYDQVTWSIVDEPIGHWNNQDGFRASFVAPDLIKIEDLKNAGPGLITAEGDNFTTVTTDNGPVIKGIDPQKIGNFYDEQNDKIWPEAKFCAVPVYNDKFTGHPDYKKYQNNLNKHQKLILNTQAAGEQYRNAFTCFPYVAHILEHIFKLSGQQTYGAFLQDFELKQLVLWNNFANDQVLVDSVTNFQIRVPSSEINLNQNVKGTQVEVFLKELRKIFGLNFIFRGTSGVELTLNRDIATSTEYDDWSNKDIGTEEIFVEDEIEGYSFKMGSGDSYFSSQVKDLTGFVVKEDVNTKAILDSITTDSVDTIRGVLPDKPNHYVQLYRCVYSTSAADYTTAWVPFGIRIESQTVNDGSIEIKSGLGVPLMFYIDENTEGRPKWSVPRVDEEGRSLFEIGDIKSPAPLRIMFYRDVEKVYFKEGSAYMERETYQASTTSFRQFYDFLNFNYSLQIKGEIYYSADYNNKIEFLSGTGTYNQFWKAFCEMMLNARKVKKRFALSLLDILTLDLVKKKYSNGQLYLLDNLTFELGTDDTIILESECWRL